MFSVLDIGRQWPYQLGQTKVAASPAAMDVCVPIYLQQPCSFTISIIRSSCSSWTLHH